MVTTPPYYPDWQVWRGYRATRYTHEVWQGVRVWRAPLWVGWWSRRCAPTALCVARLTGVRAWLHVQDQQPV